MKIWNAPYVIVFLSSMFPLLGGVFNFNMYHMPLFLVIMAIGLALIAKQNFVIKKNILTTFAAPALLLIIITQLTTGRGFVTLGVGGYVLIFAVVFLGFLSTGGCASMISIVRGISSLYKFFLISMLFELVLIFLGLQSYLVSIFAGYKDYNSADVLRYFGFMENAGGLNSVLLGSQIAGMLSLFSAIWFLGIDQLRLNGLVIGNNRNWMKLSILVYLITTNGTNLLLLVLASGIYIIYFNKKNRAIYFSIFFLLCFVLYLMIYNGLVLNRVFNNQNLVHLQPDDIDLARKNGNYEELQTLTTFGYYVYTFFEPVETWLAVDLSNKLLGVGAAFFLNENVAGDFGIAIGTLSSGLLWASIFLMVVSVNCISVLREVEVGSVEEQLWSALGAINAMITLLWLASTIHYNQAYANPGGMTIFALHFAVTLYCSSRAKLSKSTVRPGGVFT